MGNTDIEDDQLNHHLRVLLFEKGIVLSPKKMAQFISAAHLNCLNRLQQAALTEGLIHQPILSQDLRGFLRDMQFQMQFAHPQSPSYAWNVLHLELVESIANDAMALAFKQDWNNHLRQSTRQYATLWMWLHSHLTSQECLSFLEQWGCIGHPYHPNYRCKSGFNRREVLQYSPEFNAQVTLHWAALKNNRAHTTHSAMPYKPLLNYYFRQEYQAWAEQLSLKKINPEHYLPVPMHPWQWQNQVKTVFSTLIEEKELVLIPHLQQSQPTMSFRTMIPQSAKHCHLKLACAVHTTSCLRTVSPASIDNNPSLTHWLLQLLAEEHHYQQNLFLAGDLAGLNVNHPAISLQHRSQLALLLRANPVDFSLENQRLVPLASLFAVSPLSQKPLLIEIIESSGMEAEAYFTHYCDCILKGQLPFMLRYGIALESHQQNTLVNFEQHQPISLVIRDLGGIKVSTNPVYDKLQKPCFHPNSTIISPRLDDICNKFIHGNLQSNLACWIALLHQYYGIPLPTLWKKVYLTFKTHFKKLETTIEPVLLDWYKEQLLNKPWPHKSLLSMRLYGKEEEDMFAQVQNPLSIFR